MKILSKEQEATLRRTLTRAANMSYRIRNSEFRNPELDNDIHAAIVMLDQIADVGVPPLVEEPASVANVNTDRGIRSFVADSVRGIPNP